MMYENTVKNDLAFECNKDYGVKLSICKKKKRYLFSMY